jgi:hypothetical protein
MGDFRRFPSLAKHVGSHPRRVIGKWATRLVFAHPFKLNQRLGEPRDPNSLTACCAALLPTADFLWVADGATLTGLWELEPELAARSGRKCELL